MDPNEVGMRQPPVHRSRHVIIAIGVTALVCSGLAAWWMTRSSQLLAQGESANPPATNSPVKAPPASGQATVVAEQTTTADAAASAERVRLQRRLNALAEAYVRGDGLATRQAMWPNHAVIRPDGERLERQELLEIWAGEWDAFRNRDLKFYVDEVMVDGNKVTAIWTIVLTADVEDAYGESHHMMINGKQQATYLRSGDTQTLEGPIEYIHFERTLNGFAWPLE